jgi:hypothetical protein
LYSNWQRWTTEGPEFESHEGKEFSLLHIIHTGSEAHLAYPIGTGFFFPRRGGGGVKHLVLKADHSPSTSAAAKNTWIYISTPPYVSME